MIIYLVYDLSGDQANWIYFYIMINLGNNAARNKVPSAQQDIKQPENVSKNLS